MRVEHPHDVVVAFEKVAELKAKETQASCEGQIQQHVWEVEKHILQSFKEIFEGCVEIDKSSHHESEVIHHDRSVLALIPNVVKVQKQNDHEERRKHPHSCLFGSGDSL